MPVDMFRPYQMGDLVLANRLVMAPLTRNRAAGNGMVPPMMVAHYRERAAAGLIITESTPVSPQAVGYPFTPGIYTEPQVASWGSVRRGGAPPAVAGLPGRLSRV